MSYYSRVCAFGTKEKKLQKKYKCMNYISANGAVLVKISSLCVISHRHHAVGVPARLICQVIGKHANRLQLGR